MILNFELCIPCAPRGLVSLCLGPKAGQHEGQFSSRYQDEPSEDQRARRRDEPVQHKSCAGAPPVGSGFIRIIVSVVGHEGYPRDRSNKY